MDYGYPEKRKNKKDDRKKRLNRGYKRGGQFRSTNIVSSEQENK